MVSKLWFRFGIPLGSAVTLAALLDFTISTYWFLNDFGSYLYFHVWEHELTPETKSIVCLVAVSVKFLLTIALWIFVLLGRRVILLFWIPLSVITDIVLVIHGINNNSHGDFISDEIWFINIAVVILLRSYLTCIIYQAFYRLLQNARAEAELEKNFEIDNLRKHQSPPANNGNVQQQQQSNGNVPLQSPKDDSFHSCSNNKGVDGNPAGGVSNSSSEASGSGTSSNNGPAKEILIIEKSKDVTTIWENLGHIGKKGNNFKRNLRNEAGAGGGGFNGGCVPGGASSSPRFLLIEPIGFSPIEIWEFFSDTPRLGAAVMVWFEVIWNVFALSTHSLTEFVFGGSMFFMLKEEEIMMRVWRIVVDVAALFFIFNRKKTSLRFWLIIYFWTLFASLCIFVYVMADWVDPPPITVIVTCLIWLGDNCVRFGIVYFCLRVTVQPRAFPDSPGGGTEVGRSHSLRSQSRPRSRKMKAALAKANLPDQFDSIQQQPPPPRSPGNSIEIC